MSKYQFDGTIYLTVAKNIKRIREEKKLSIEDLGLYAELDTAYLKELESLNGNITISIYDLYKISVILDTSIDKFFI